MKAVWSQAGQVQEHPLRGAQYGSSLKSLESVVQSLHSTASQQIYTGTPTSSKDFNGSSSDVVVFNGQLQDSTTLETSDYRGDDSLSVSSNDIPAYSGAEDFTSPGSSSGEPYPVFLPNFSGSKSETHCTNSSSHEIAKHEGDLTHSPYSVSLPQNNLEPENHVGVSPSTPDSEVQGNESEVSAVTSLMANGLCHLESAGRSVAGKHLVLSHSVGAEKDQRVEESAMASSTGDSAFFDFLLRQGSEFNPSIKFQIVELIKSEFGKKMASFDSEICLTETEKQRLEAEIHNNKIKLQQKEEEKLRLFTEIDNLQKSIIQATEKHKVLVQQCNKLKVESNAVKRKISSCEEVERELCGNPAKLNKLSER